MPTNATEFNDLSSLPEGALLTSAEVAALLRVAVTSLANWRSSSRNGKNIGPRFVKVGETLVRYYARDVRAFLEKGGLQ